MSFAGLDLGETYQPTTIQAGPHGTLTGSSVLAKDGSIKCRRFCQIPYAHPPVGEYRWRAPRALPEDYKWDQVDGENFGNITAQPEYAIKGPDGRIFPTKVNGRNLSEDALTINVWTPAGEPPAGGWPVYVYLHGGWLQIGNPAMTDKNNSADLLNESGVKVVIVAVAYRLSAFGFLASKEIAAENEDGTAGNFGFMDQRLGLEWTSKNVQYFGGNPTNITLGGPSAGSYSTQFQLCHEFNFSETTKPLIKRVIMYSNAIPAQPKSIEQSQPAFDGLCEAFGIGSELEGAEKMKKLRAIPEVDLMNAIMKLKIHTFRAVSDGVFVHKDTMERIRTGDFARRFKQRDMAIIIGEVEAEEYLYGATNPPQDLPALRTQLQNYYRDDQVTKIQSLYDVPKKVDPSSEEDMAALQAVYGKMVADGQVYVPSRSLVETLFKEGIGMDRILRYRISWRPKGTDLIGLFPGKVSHSDDTWAWWYSKRYGFTDEDCEITKSWLAPILPFLLGDIDKASKIWWSENKGGSIPSSHKTQRILRDGKIVVVEDDRWDRCMGLAEAIKV